MDGIIIPSLLGVVRILASIIAQIQHFSGDPSFWTFALLLLQIFRLPEITATMELPTGQSRAETAVSDLVARMQQMASGSPCMETDQKARAQLLQLSRELSARLEQPDEVVSLVAFSVNTPSHDKAFLSPAPLSPWLIFTGRSQHVRQGGGRPSSI